VFCLESLERAQGRGAGILGEIVGYGSATDCHHVTQPHPRGDAAFQSMESACASAGMAPKQIEYVNAHGTGTPLNDTAEALAINRLFGPASESLYVSSTKSSIGHLLGAAGAVEAMVCAMVLREQWLPPTTTSRKSDPVCAFKLVREPAEAKINYALTNSFGFGGANATLILRRWNE
jgi:3-oxoacyl-[acyl-carrier-protein] synthase II